jgi:hypothetical protein
MTQESMDLGPDVKEPESAPDAVLDSPEVKTELKRQRERIRKGETKRGKTAEELLNLTRERQ